MPPLLLLKAAWRRRDILLLTACLFLVGVVKSQHGTITTLRAHPSVEYRDRIVEKRVVAKGPVRIVKVKAPDGTVTTTTDRAPETITTDRERDKERLEIPPQLPPVAQRNRYAGLGVNPLDYTHQWRGRGGITLFGALDAGVAVDVEPQKLILSRPMVELTYRF